MANKGFHIVKLIYMEVETPKHLRRKEALFTLEVCEDSYN